MAGKETAYLGENKFSQNDLLEELAEPVFTAEKNVPFGPIQTPLGWHVLTLTKITAEGIEPFDKIKKALRNDMLQERLIDELIEASNMLDDRLASGEELDTIIAEMGLTTKTVEEFTQAGTSLTGKDKFKTYGQEKVDILDTTFSLDHGESSPVLELADGRFITVRIDSVINATHKPFESVKSSLKTRWVIDQKAAANKLRAQQALAALKEGKDIDAVTKEVGGAKKKLKSLIRSAETKAPLTDSTHYKIFSEEENTPLMLETKDGYLVGVVTQIKTADASKATKKDLNKIIAEESAGLKEEIIAQYINTLSLRYKVKINERLLKSLYSAPAEN